MIILKPVESITEMFVEDILEHPKGWLKMLFVDTGIGYILSGVASVALFFVVSTTLYWIR